MFSLKHACICSVYFDESSFEIPLKQQMLNYKPKNSRNLKADAIPIKNFPFSTRSTKHCKSIDEREKRQIKRNKRKEFKEIVENLSPNIDYSEEIKLSNSEVNKQDNEVNFLKNKIAELKCENDKLTMKCKQLIEQNTELMTDLTTKKK